MRLLFSGDFMVDGESLVVGGHRHALRVLVSSTVYGKEDFLERVYQLLAGLGYDVRMSYAGTIPVNSSMTAYENCLKAIDDCDLFLGIITTEYGSGIIPSSGLSITHAEIKRAIELKKPRWMLVDSRVPFMRNWLKAIGVEKKKDRISFISGLSGGKIAKGHSPFELGKHAFDLRTIDMYEEAIRDFEFPNAIRVEERKGNWVQPFMSPNDIDRFVVAQFARSEDALRIIKETFHANS